MTEASRTQAVKPEQSNRNLKEALIVWVDELILDIGYRVVDLEIHRGKGAKLQIFIEPQLGSEKTSITVDDCARVSQFLDQPLDTSELLGNIFKGGYDLEVSSPGINRPLRTMNDFEKFVGQKAKMSLFRSLTEEEIENDSFIQKNPRQKLFLGELVGTEREKQKIILNVPKNKLESENVKIPIGLVSKANLDPEIDFEKGKQK